MVKTFTAMYKENQNISAQEPLNGSMVIHNTLYRATMLEYIISWMLNLLIKLNWTIM